VWKRQDTSSDPFLNKKVKNDLCTVGILQVALATNSATRAA
jgi:hypothetical protein